jgi:hypothetical protein
MHLYLYQDIWPWVECAVGAFTVCGFCFGVLAGKWHERRYWTKTGPKHRHWPAKKSIRQKLYSIVNNLY